MGRISVIIPTYNRADLLTESIKAIQNQTYAVYEIIVVDDGSTDGTRAAVSALPGSIKYVYQPNAGKAVALNNGLNHCSGDYIWICDDDDLTLPRAAELLVNGLNSSSSAGFAFGRYKRFSTNPRTGEQQISEPVYWPDLKSKSFLVGLLLDCFIFQNACLVRREALDAVGPFRTDLIRSQDYEMTIRLACQFDALMFPRSFSSSEHIKGFADLQSAVSTPADRWRNGCTMMRCSFASFTERFPSRYLCRRVWPSPPRRYQNAPPYSSAHVYFGEGNFWSLASAIWPRRSERAVVTV